MMGAKNGTCGEFSRSIQTFRLDLGSALLRSPPWDSCAGALNSGSILVAGLEWISLAA